MTKLVFIFSRLIISDLFLKGLTAINSILLLNALGANIAGKYFLLVAAFGIFPALVNASDQVLSRFIPVISAKERSLLAAGALLFKIYGSAICFLSTLVILVTLPELSSKIFSSNSTYLILIAGVGFSVLPLFQSWCSRLLTAYESYGFQIKTDVYHAVAITSWFALALFAFDIRTLEHIILGMCAVGLMSTVVKVKKILTHDPLLRGVLLRGFISPRSSVGEILSAKYRSYLMPFFLISMTSFFKEHLPVLAVGYTSGTQDSAGFRVVQQIFRMTHSLVPNAFELLRSGLVLQQLKGEKTTGASPKYQYYAELYLLASGLFVVAMLITLPNLLWIWSLLPSSPLYWVIVILGIDLLFGSATHIEFQIYLLKKNIDYLAFMSISRQIITTIIIYFASNLWGQVGVALGTAVGAFYAWTGFLAYSANNNLRPHAFLFRTSVILLLITLAVIAVSFVVFTYSTY